MKRPQLGKSNIAKSLVLLIVASSLSSVVALLFTMQGGPAAASPNGDGTENLWVNYFDNNVMDWTEVGNWPYLDTENISNRVGATKADQEEGNFRFSDLASPITIDNVMLNIYGQAGGGETMRVHLWDGSSWVASYDFSGGGLQWFSADVTSILDTYTKVNSAEIYLESAKSGAWTGPVSAVAARLEVAYTIPPPEEPENLQPDNGTATADSTPTFSWENGAYASSHRIEVGNDLDWSSVLDNVVASNTWTENEGYSTGKYYWRVWAINASGENVSDVYEFTITTWWDVDWTNRRKIEINPINPENYQIRVLFDNISGMKSNLSDLRFLENAVTSETLPHWVENYTADNATIWIRRLENADNSIYVYYSNPSAPSIENGDNVFIKYDHFLGTSLDIDKWKETSGTVSVSDSVVTLENASDERLRSSEVENYLVPTILRCKAKLGTGAPSDIWLIGSSTNTAMRYETVHKADTNTPSQETTLGSPADQWYTYEMRREDDQTRFYLDDNLEATHTLSDASDVYIWFIADPGGKVEVDWALIRKFASSEPVTTVGAQEPPPVLPTKPTLYYPSDSSTITDETPEFVWTKGKNADNHRLLVSSDNTFTSIVENKVRGYDNYWEIPNDNFLSDGKYWWKVTAFSENGENTSLTWSFAMKAISVFEASSGVDKIWSSEVPAETYDVEMSENGDYIAVGTYGGHLVYFSKNDNEPLWTANPEGLVGAVDMTDDGQYIAVGTYTGKKVVFYDNEGNVDWSYTAASDVLRKGVKVSGDGAFVTAGTDGGKVLVFKGISGDGTLLSSYETGDTIRDTAISELVDGKYRVAAVSEDWYIYFWDNAEDISTPTWKYKTGYRTYGEVEVSEKGDYIAVAAWDNMVYLFDNVDNTPIWTYEHTDNTVFIDYHMWFTIDISDNGQYIAAGMALGQGLYALWSKDDNTPLWTHEGQEVRDIKISGDGTRVVAGGWDGRTIVWGREDNTPIWFYGEAYKRPGAVAISGDGSLVASTTYETLHLLQDGSFAYDLLTEEQSNPRRVLTQNPEFSFKLPSRKAENTIGFCIQVGENIFDVENLMWNSLWEIENEENIIYRAYAGTVLSPYTTYYWRIKLKDNENNWSPWSVNRNFEIVELSDFSYYRVLSFTEDIPDNYQVKVVIDNTTNIDENFKDLLFYDSAYPNAGLSYWTENISENVVWVKIHDNGNIRMCYNNDSVEDASNGDDTFPDLFDNFPGDDVDFRKWTFGGTGTLTVSDGILTLSGDKTIWTKETHGANKILRVKANIENSIENQYVGFVLIDPKGAWGKGYICTPATLFWGKNDNLYLRAGLYTYGGWDAGVPENSRITSTASASNYLNTFTIFELKRGGSDNVELWANDDNLVLSHTSHIPTARIPFYFQSQSSSPLSIINVDWVFIREYLAVEPTVTIGEQEIWGWEQIESWTGTIQNPAPPSVENLYITDIDNTDTDNLIPETQYKFWVEVADNKTLAAIENMELVIYLDNENLPDAEENHYTFRWTRDGGFEEIDGLIEQKSIVIENNVDWTDARLPSQHKLFSINDRFWLFAHDEETYVNFWRTSLDGQNWTDRQDVGYNTSVAAHFAVWYDDVSGNFHTLAYGFYNMGEPLDNGDINWSGWDGMGIGSQDVHICTDSEGYPWAGQYAPTTKDVGIDKSSTNDGTWTATSGFPYQLDNTAGEKWNAIPVPLQDSQVYVVYGGWDGELPENIAYGKLWDGDSWGARENVTTTEVSRGYYSMFGAASKDNDVYFIFLSKNEDIIFVKRTWGSGWGSEEIVQSSVSTNSVPVMVVDKSTEDFYVFWANNDHIYYKKRVNGNWDESPTDWIDESTDDISPDYAIVSAYEVYDNRVMIYYATETNGGSPDKIKFAYFELGAYEHLIVENCVPFDNTKTVDNIVFAIEFGEDATVTANDNWDVWVQVYDSAGNEDNRFFLNQFDIVSEAQWNLIETWTGTVQAPAEWQSIESWSGMIEAPAGWNAIEEWSGTVEAPVGWQLIETWSGTVKAYAEWILTEQWSGAVQAPSEWNLIEQWDGIIIAPAQWGLVESWLGAVEAFSGWQLVETWTGTVEAVAQWNLVESWSGTVQAPSEWNLIETWTGTIEAPAAWSLVEEWSGAAQAPTAWTLIESWSGTVQAPTAWDLIETWDGTLEAPTAWNLIESWTGTVEAFVGWQLIETWSGIVQTPTAWQLVETWSGTVEALAEWQQIESWTGMVEAPSEWTLIESWTGSIEVSVGWQLIESWAGAVEAYSGWVLLETWSGTLEAFVGWQLVETWGGTVEAFAEWQTIETWNGTIQTTAGWLLVETWTGTAESPSAWQLVESWVGTVEAFAEWNLVESWTGAIESPAGWVLIETWLGEIQAPVAWQLIETWEGTIEVPAGWWLIESWVGTLEAFAEWNLMETWEGAIETHAQWDLVESWDGAIIAPVAWGLVETWGGTVEAFSGWQLAESWSGTIQALGAWNLMESWSGTILAYAEWSEVESWTGTACGVGWRLIESWGGTVHGVGWRLIETWTGSVRTAAVYAVIISISPSENSGTLGDTLTYTVTVANIGGVIDNYDLAASDSQGWTVYLDDDALGPIASEGDDTTTLNVGLTTTGTHTVSVTATSQGDSSVSDSMTCTATSTTIPTYPTHPGGTQGEGNVALGIAILALGLGVVALAFFMIARRREEEAKEIEEEE